jgi:hypothetical protein
MRLPSEILTLIAADLARPDLLNLCFVSKLWHEISEPLLWRRFTFARADSFDFSWRPSAPRQLFDSLIRRLIDQPERAEWIRRLDLRSWSTLLDHEDNDYEPSRLTQRDFLDFFDLAKQLHIISENASASFYIDHPDKAIHDQYHRDYNPEPNDGNCPEDRDWVNLLHAGYEEPLVMVLVALLPRLEVLQIRWVPREFLSWNRLQRVPHGFKHLKKLILPEINNHLPKFTSLLAAPKMDMFEGINGADSCYPEYRTVSWIFPAGASTITQLYLDHFALNLESITSLIDFCRGLKTFYYRSGGYGVGTNQFTFPDVIRKLQKHKDTLEHLALSWTDSDLNSTYNPGLRNFEKLKVLDIQTNLLNCPDNMKFFDVIPPSVEVFALEFMYPWIEVAADPEEDASDDSYDDGYDAAILHLLEFAIAISEKRFPNLKSFFAVFFGEEDDPNLEKIGTRVRQANTTFDISPYGTDYGAFLRRFRGFVESYRTSPVSGSRQTLVCR